MQRFEGKRLQQHAGRWFALSALLLVPLGGLLALFPDLAEIVAPIAVVGLMVVWIAAMAWAMRPRPLYLEVAGGQLVVDEGRGGTFSLDGASVGPWLQPGLGVVGGTVLHFRSSTAQFHLLGHDHRLPAGVRATEAPSSKADAMLALEPFGVLFSMTPLARAASGDTKSALRFALSNNPSAPSSVVMTMLPWMGTMVIVSVLGAFMGVVMEHLPPHWILWVGTPIIALTLVGGLVLTVVQHKRRLVPQLELELDPHELRLHRVGRGLVHSASRSSIELKRVTHALPRGSGRYPSIVLVLPEGPKLAIGVYDPRFGWSDAVPRGWSAPRYVVGAPDWRALIQALRVPNATG